MTGLLPRQVVLVGAVGGTVASVSKSSHFLGPVLVVDLGHLQVRDSAGVVTLACGSTLLGVAVPPADLPERERTLFALDAVSAGSFIQVDLPDTYLGHGKAKVAWLNPFTSTVSLGPSDDCYNFSDLSPLVLPSPCVVGVAAFDEQSSRCLVVAGRTLPLRAPLTHREFSRVLASHRG